MLLSAWFAARGSEGLYRWLWNHPYFAKLLRDWQKHGGKIEMVTVNPEKAAQVIIAKSGMTMFVPGNTHNMKNIGSTEIILIETELKKPETNE